jgi:hypothetical protein
MANYYKVLFQEEEHLGVGYTVEKQDIFQLPDVLPQSNLENCSVRVSLT